jgi:hypothetical protein
LSRRISRACFVALVLITGTGSPTVAQQKSAADFYLPTLAKKFPPGRVSTCAAQCGNLQNDLNKLWKKLHVHDFGTASDLRPWAAAMEANNPAAAKAAHDKMAKKWGEDNTKTEENGLQSILTDIALAADRLAACEKKCAQAAQKPGGGTDTGGGTGTGGETVTPKITLPTIPDCWTEDEKMAFLNKWSNVLKEQQQEAKKYKDLVSFYDEKIKEGKTLTASEVRDQKDAATKQKQYQENVDALNAILEKADAKPAKKKKEDCNPKDNIYKSSKFIFPGHGYYSKPGGNTYNVTFSGDSTQQCTFADGAGLPAPVEFADAKGNPLETYFDPKTGESSDFGPDETPPPGWKKVIPTTDPKPEPGMWNLGNQPELWVDPQTGQTKWVEVGSDYKPVDPPQSWVELVPRSEPSKQTAETPPTRTTETPPQTPTTETPRTPTTETPRTPTTETPPTRTTDGPPTQTMDVPPTTPPTDGTTTFYIKANQQVVEGGPTGQPLVSQTVKLLAALPPLLGTGVSKTAGDRDFDKPTAQCTTGADGLCEVLLSADELPVYGLPVIDTAARRPNYRIEFNALKSSGGVAEITGRKPAAGRAPAGGNVASDIFNIGNRIFQRFGFNTPYESREDVEASYRSTFGDRYQVDTCEKTKPGPPLGMEPISFDQPSHELSQAVIKFDRTVRSGRNDR